MPKPFCPPKGTPSSTLPNAVNTLLPPSSVLPKKSGLYPKSPSKPMTPAPIHARLAPQLRVLASIASLNSVPASPPKFQPMNGMNKPSAFAAPGERPQSSAAMISVRQMRVDELVVMPDERAFDVPLFVRNARLAPAREIARTPPPWRTSILSNVAAPRNAAAQTQTGLSTSWLPELEPGRS